METIKARGIVAKRSDYGEANCILTVFTENLGTVSVAVYGVKSSKSRLKAVSQPLCFSEFILTKKNGNIYRAESADIIETFYPISEDIVKLSLANYFFEIVRDNFSDNDGETLKLLLNTLYLLAYKDVDLTLVKAVFELKMMQYLGYEPNMLSCINCGATESLSAFSLDGGLICEKCKSSSSVKLSKNEINAMRYVLSSDIKKIYSFTASDAVLERLSLICEGYLLNKNEKRYKSLEYYKKVK